MKEETSIRIRPMSAEDIGLGMRLKDGAGWNQVPADWRAYLQLEPDGCFVADLDGRAVATTTAIRYEDRLGWIGMVLVDPTARRRGLATRLIEHALAYLDVVPCQKLDATEAGARVYEKMGFRVEYEVQRWSRFGKRSAVKKDIVPGLRPLSVNDLDRLVPFDRAAFGASRNALLQWYGSNNGPRCIVEEASQPTGYIVGRPGSKAWQMGPLVAKNSDLAEALMSAYLFGLPDEPVIADVVAENRAAVGLLEQFGFARQRVLERMYRGENAWPGRPQEMFCLAGFEFG